MATLIAEKFGRHPDLASKLVSTGSVELIEGNWCGDTYWGICRGKGQNNLGKILMVTRQQLMEGTSE
jgi:predicted NAD-dependent protein-ADP-ribosyltransferase YbiA (DUF1768 family)